jgi:predicted negative regulator of RcsB-dependent stress response
LLLMEGSIFWSKYKLPIVAAVVLLIVALVASEFYEADQDKKIHAASAELDNARTASDYRHVMETFPGTMAAANATLLLGREQFDGKDYAGAAATWRSFADKNPQHSLAPVALIGAGTALEAVGRNDEARSAFQRAATSYTGSFAAPLARLDEATLLKAEGKPEEARHVYENLMASNASSDAGQEAAEELRFLRVMPSAPGTTPAPAPAKPAERPLAPTAVTAPAASVAPASSAAPAGSVAPAASVAPGRAVTSGPASTAAPSPPLKP